MYYVLFRHDDSFVQASASLQVQHLNDWMEHFHRQFPSGQRLSSNQRRYRFQTNNMMRQSAQVWLNEDPYLKWRDFCFSFSNPGSTQIQLWQFLLDLLKVGPSRCNNQLLSQSAIKTKYFRRQSTVIAFNGKG